MRALFLAIALAAGLTRAPPQTSSELLRQIAAPVKQLQAQLAPAAPATTRVSTVGGLVAAVKAGGTIEVSPGTYVINLVLAAPVTLRGPSDVVLVPADPLSPTVLVTGNDIGVTGLTIQSGAPDREAVVVGSLSATSADVQPHRVRFTQVAVTAKAGGHRGFALHGVDITLERVTVTGFSEKGRDSQAVWICNGPGPYSIIDSVLEASGENILVGGADPGIVGMNPANITIRGNLLRKPDTYKGIGTVKNSFELKTGLHVLFEGNTIDGNWADGQAGSPIVLTVRNQDGDCTWCQVDDVIIRGNTVRRAPQGFSVNILGSDNEHPSAQTQTILIDHNLFVDATNGIQVGNGVATRLTVTHNTWPAITGKALSFHQSKAPRVITPLTFARNVLRSGSYGITGNGTTVIGLPSLLAFCTVTEFTGNVIERTAERTIAWPQGNTLVAPAGLAALLDPKTWKLLSGGAGY